jgi:hypothetical protein
MNVRRVLAREWLYFVIFIGMSPIIFPILFSIIVTVIHPINKVDRERSFAWWNYYSQKELEEVPAFSSDEFERTFLYRGESLYKDIHRWIEEIEQSPRFQKRPMSERNRGRMGYAEAIIKEDMLDKEKADSLKKRFFKLIMEIEKSRFKKENIWKEPKEDEIFTESRTRWDDMWLSQEAEILAINKLKLLLDSFFKEVRLTYSLIIEGLKESFFQCFVILMTPYFVFQLIRSVIWSRKQFKRK